MAFIGRPNGGSIENIVKCMKVGERGYIDCDAIAFDTEKKPYLDLTASVAKRKNKEEAYKIFIRRIGPGRADYEIYAKKKRHTWVVQEKPFSEDYPDDEYWKQDIVQLEYKEHSPSKQKNLEKRLPRASLKQRLQRDINSALKGEEYEKAAQLRDRLNKLHA